MLDDVELVVLVWLDEEDVLALVSDDPDVLVDAEVVASVALVVASASLAVTKRCAATAAGVAEGVVPAAVPWADVSPTKATPSWGVAVAAELAEPAAVLRAALAPLWVPPVADAALSPALCCAFEDAFAVDPAPDVPDCPVVVLPVLSVLLFAVLVDELSTSMVCVTFA